MPACRDVDWLEFDPVGDCGPHESDGMSGSLIGHRKPDFGSFARVFFTTIDAEITIETSTVDLHGRSRIGGPPISSRGSS